MNALNLTLQELYDEVTRLALWMVYLGLMSFVAYWGQYTLLNLAAIRQVKKLREAYLKAMLKQDIAWFDQVGAGALTQRISSDTVIIEEAIGSKFGDMLRFVSTFFSGFIMGFVNGWKMTLVLIAVTPLLAIAGAFLMWVMSSLSKKGQDAYADAGAIATEVISAIKTVASFGGERKEAERYSVNLDKAAQLGIKRGFLAGLGLGLTFLLMFATYALALWYGTQLVINDGYRGGDVLTVFFAVIFGAFALGQASPSFQKLGEAQGAAFKLFETINRPTVVDPTSDAGEKLDGLKGNIEMRNIKFRYATRPDVEVLKGLNLSIKEGQMVALVGASGCGKSSTVSLIQRFYDAEAGQILVDGHDLKDLNLKWWRQQLGLVSQEPVLFAGTIAENISYGKENATKEEIMEAAKFANAHNFVSQLPDGYETFVGEKGAQLSGGQKQRIAIARAIIKNPKILLLDEATSALDSESEKIVQEALDRVMKGRTTIVIAHRLSTIRDANLIAVFQNGVIAELGTHDELLAKQGPYFELVKLQGGGQINEPKKSKKEDKLRSTVDKKEKVAEVTAVNQEDDDEKNLYQVGFGRLFSLNKPEIPHILLACLASALNGALNPVFSIVFSELIDLYYKDADTMRSEVKVWAAAFCGLGLAAFVVNTLQAGLFGYAGEKLTLRLREMSFKSILRQDIAFFDKEEHLPSVLTSNLAQDATLVQGLLGPRLGLGVQNVVTIIVGLVIAFEAGWKLTLVLLSVAPAMLFANVMEMLSYKGLGQQTKKATSAANQIAAESIGNIRTVAAFTTEQKVLSKYRSLLDRPYKLSLRKETLSGFLFGLSECLLFFAQALSFWYGGVLIKNGEYTFLNVMKVFMAVFMSAMSIGQATAMAPDAKKAKRAASSMFQIIDEIPRVDPYSFEGKVPNGAGSISIKGLEFAYPSRPDANIFSGLDLKIKSGQVVALVGPSGCGKSSIVSLVERFYTPAKGEILIDGENIKDLNVQELRKMIGLVGQEPVLFKGTIAENISYGKPGASNDEIIDATKSANAHKFITQFPDGYNTQVGEKGTQLSGGQKQRIAIARAIIRNPKILLLDEATSALDTESEKVVQEALDRVMKGRTTIVIAHRLSTIRHADHIVVIQAGKIVEQGTHDQLLDMGGLYYSLVARQQR